MMKFITKDNFNRLVSFVFWILVWQFIYIAVNKEILVVSPFAVIKRLFDLSFTYDFWIVILFSVIRILKGIFLGISAGVFLSVLCFKYKLIYILFYPVLSVVKSTPVASFIIIALVWIKSENMPSFISFLMIMPIIWGNLYEGIKNIDNKFIELSKVFKLNRKSRLLNIYIPSVMPYFISACLTGIGIAWKSGIAAEILSLPKFSIGTQLYNSKVYIETLDLFSWTIVIIILSILFEIVFKFLIYKINFKKIIKF